MSRWVQLTDNEDGSADITIQDGEENHRFSVSVDHPFADLYYDETLSTHLVVRNRNPGEDVWMDVMISEEMTDFLDEYQLQGVRRQ